MGELEMVKAGHLGGYIKGGDPATYYPELWDWLIEIWEVKSMIDVGCGEGHALQYFESKGCEVLGVDGVAQPHQFIVQHDYARGPYRPPPNRPDPSEDAPGFRYAEYDLAWSCEFVEHVEEQYVPNFIETFRCARFVLMTHGEPGQPGWHHVNNQTSEYWKGVLSGAGFEFDQQLTAMTRGFASANLDPFNHFRRSGLAFRRRS